MKTNNAFYLHKCLQKNTLIILIMIIFGCGISPHNSTFESAKTLGKNKIEASSHFSQHSILGSQSLGNYGFKLSCGLSDNTDLKVSFDKFYENLNYFELGLKFSMTENKSAFVLPIGFYNTGLNNSYIVSPKFIVTHIRKINFDFSTSYKLDLPLSGGIIPTFGFNATLGLSNNISKWAVRPEFGIKFPLTIIIPMISFGIGFSYTL